MSENVRKKPAMSDIVERVARALCDEAGYVWEKIPDMPDAACGYGQPEGCKYYWRRLAIAAIKGSESIE